MEPTALHIVGIRTHSADRGQVCVDAIGVERVPHDHVVFANPEGLVEPSPVVTGRSTAFANLIGAVWQESRLRCSHTVPLHRLGGYGRHHGIAGNLPAAHMNRRHGFVDDLIHRAVKRGIALRLGTMQVIIGLDHLNAAFDRFVRECDRGRIVAARAVVPRVQCSAHHLVVTAVGEGEHTARVLCRSGTHQPLRCVELGNAYGSQRKHGAAR